MYKSKLQTDFLERLHSHFLNMYVGFGTKVWLYPFWDYITPIWFAMLNLIHYWNQVNCMYT
jgi:hypothetical protein